MCMAESEREEEKEVIFEVMLAWKHEMLLGYPMGKDEVACIKSTLPFLFGFGPLGRDFREGKEKFGLFPLSPKLELVRVCFMLKRM